MPELAEKRKERDQAFDDFFSNSMEKSKFDVAARAARQRYMLAAEEVKAMERDMLSYPVESLS